MSHGIARCWFGWLLAAFAALSLARTDAAEPLVFISAFAAGEEGAIHAYRLHTPSGRWESLRRNGEVEHPFYLALSPQGRFLYSIHAPTFGGAEPEQVAAYQILGDDGQLKLLNRQSSQGSASCYLDVDADGTTLVVANYTTGSVASLPIAADGSLAAAASFVQHAGASVDPQRQEGPHAHCLVISPDNRFAYAADLGLDQILCYRLVAKASQLEPNRQPFVRTPPGAGPRHLTFHPRGQQLYVINELANSITQFDYDADGGMLIERETVSTLPEDFDGTSYCADLRITPDGRFLYGTNRGHDSIACYAIGDGGRLRLIEIRPSLGKGPQNLAITRDGGLLLCANMPANNVVVFRIDGTTGRLEAVGDPLSIPKPSCIQLLYRD